MLPTTSNDDGGWKDKIAYVVETKKSHQNLLRQQKFSSDIREQNAVVPQTPCLRQNSQGQAHENRRSWSDASKIQIDRNSPTTQPKQREESNNRPTGTQNMSNQKSSRRHSKNSGKRAETSHDSKLQKEGLSQGQAHENRQSSINASKIQIDRNSPTTQQKQKDESNKRPTGSQNMTNQMKNHDLNTFSWQDVPSTSSSGLVSNQQNKPRLKKKLLPLRSEDLDSSDEEKDNLPLIETQKSRRMQSENSGKRAETSHDSKPKKEGLSQGQAHENHPSSINASKNQIDRNSPTTQQKQREESKNRPTGGQNMTNQNMGNDDLHTFSRQDVPSTSSSGLVSNQQNPPRLKKKLLPLRSEDSDSSDQKKDDLPLIETQKSSRRKSENIGMRAETSHASKLSKDCLPQERKISQCPVHENCRVWIDPSKIQMHRTSPTTHQKQREESNNGRTGIQNNMSNQNSSRRQSENSGKPTETSHASKLKNEGLSQGQAHENRQSSINASKIQIDRNSPTTQQKQREESKNRPTGGQNMTNQMENDDLPTFSWQDVPSTSTFGLVSNQQNKPQQKRKLLPLRFEDSDSSDQEKDNLPSIESRRQSKNSGKLRKTSHASKRRKKTYSYDRSFVFRSRKKNEEEKIPEEDRISTRPKKHTNYIEGSESDEDSDDEAESDEDSESDEEGEIDEEREINAESIKKQEIKKNETKERNSEGSSVSTKFYHQEKKKLRDLEIFTISSEEDPDWDSFITSLQEASIRNNQANKVDEDQRDEPRRELMDSAIKEEIIPDIQGNDEIDSSLEDILLMDSPINGESCPDIEANNEMEEDQREEPLRELMDSAIKEESIPDIQGQPREVELLERICNAVEEISGAFQHQNQILKEFIQLYVKQNDTNH